MLSGTLEKNQPQLDHRILLLNLKKSIELLFLARRDETFTELSNNVELFKYVHSSLESILLDGLKTTELTGDNFIKFVNDLNWLHKSFMIRDNQKNLNKTKYGLDTINPKIHHEFLSNWLQQSLINNCLCASLQLFVSDKELLQNYYTNHSFLNNENYATALFICLSAIELNQSSLLSQIDASLYNQCVPVKDLSHKRSISHPHFSISPKKNDTAGAIKINSDTPMLLSTPKKQSPILNFRKWKSLPNLEQKTVHNRPRCKTFSPKFDIQKKKGISVMTKVMEKNSVMNRKKLNSHQYSESQPSTSSNAKRQDEQYNHVKIQLVKCDDIKIWYDESSTQQFNTDNQRIETAAESLSASPPNTRKNAGTYCTPTQPKAISPINSFFSNMFSISPNRQTASGNWAYSNNLSGTSTNLSSSSQTDGVFNSFLPQDGAKIRNPNAKSLFDDSNIMDSDISELIESQFGSNGKQTLTSFLQSAGLTRNNTDLEKENAHFKVSEAIISAIEHIKCSKNEKKMENKYDCHDSQGSSSSSASFFDTTNLQRTEDLNIIIKNSSLPGSQHSIDEDEPLQISMDNECESVLNNLCEQVPNDHITYAELAEKAMDVLSAERVGLSLIAKFNDKQLPKVSDLKWLVSDEDTPQELLPMPGSSPSANPEDHIIRSFTRGTRYWAPPRQQIIFTDHIFTTRKELILKQNNRCAGCGMRVATVYINRFRYCTYLGKYHCTGCHRNQIATLPSKVLLNWDFKCYPVSVFAYRLLDQISSYPLFNVYDLNPLLYQRIKNLNIARTKRVQMKFVKDFIKTCRFAENEQIIFNEIPEYITSVPDQWSMNDFCNVKDKIMHKQFEAIIIKCEDHVFNCVLCKARGFICELCSKDNIIFPWQSKVARCDNCGTCFHQNCFKNIVDCVKCQRLRSRQQHHQ